VYEIELPKRVIKQLDKIPHKDYLSISQAIQTLKETPRPVGCKKLLEFFYRLRVRDYRVIFWIDDKSKRVVITKVGRRKESSYRDL
jgi:mRNA interferase RelE/StbE